MKVAADLTIEQKADAVTAALAEAGYPHAWGAVSVSRVTGRPCAAVEWWVSDPPVPDEVYWRACAVVGAATTCWPCWSAWRDAGFPDDWPVCDHDPWTEPWPDTREATR